MRLLRFTMAAVLAAAWPAAAAAQTVTPPPTTQTTMDTMDTFVGTTDSHWLGSAFVGGNFGEDSEDGSVDFGGSVGYLWQGVIGGEFLANFSPDFSLEPGRSALVNGTEPWISSYMANAIVAVPMGYERRWQPYVSGGLGALTLRSDTIASGDDSIDPDDTRTAANVGVGVLGFVRNIGIRGDVRWFRGFEQDADSDPSETPGEAIGSAILSDLQFWRANVGVAFKW